MHLKPAQELIPKLDKNILTVENLVRALVNLTPTTREAVRYILSNNVERQIIVKLHTDPAQPGETMWMTEAGPLGTRLICLFGHARQHHGLDQGHQ
jgi:hypothetical protein